MSIKLRILLAVLVLEIAGYSVLLSYNAGASQSVLGAVRDKQIAATLTANMNRVDAQTDLIERSALDLAGIGEHFLYLKREQPERDFEPAIRSALSTHLRRFPFAVGGGLWFEPYAYAPGKRLFGPYVYWQDGKVVFTWDLNTNSYDYPSQSWYLTGMPANWPRDRPRPAPLYWTEPYVDEAGTKALMMTADVPMYDSSGRLVGMSTIDWSMEGMRRFVAEMAITPGSRSFLIDRRSGRFVNFGLDERLVMQPVGALDWAVRLSREIQTGKIAHQSGVRFGQGEYSIYATGTRAGFVLGAMIPSADLLGELRPLLLRNVAISGVISLVFILIMLLTLRLLFRPFDQILRKIIASIGGSRQDETLQLTPLSQQGRNEFSPIIDALNQVYAAVSGYTQRLRGANAALDQQRSEISELNASLEAKVEARTHELSVKNSELTQTISHLKETQEQLIEAEKHAALSRLVAGVAHEINTPLGVAVTASSHLAESAKTTDHLLLDGSLKRSDLVAFLQLTSEAAEILSRNLDRAAMLVRSFKQISVDQTSDARRSFVIRTYLDDILMTLRPQLKKTAHQVIVDCPPDLRIDSYPGAWAQVLTNLIMNSLVHGFRDQSAGEIRITVHALGDGIELEYRDNGCGVEAENLPLIFDPFFTTNRSAGGSGLGLNIVRNLVTQALQGQIHCASTPGQGIVFTISLPVQLHL